MDDHIIERHFSIPFMTDMNAIIGNDVVSLNLNRTDFLK